MNSEMEPLVGIAAADAHLGRPVPLPAAPLPLARWVEVRAAGPRAVQVEWNLDDTRPGAPARLVLFVGDREPPEQLPADHDRRPEPIVVGGREFRVRSAPLPDAQASLRPACELGWEAGGLYLRLTGQGPWELGDLLDIAGSIGASEPSR